MVSPMTKVLNEIDEKAYGLLDWIDVIEGVPELGMLKKEGGVERGRAFLYSWREKSLRRISESVVTHLGVYLWGKGEVIDSVEG